MSEVIGQRSHDSAEQDKQTGTYRQREQPIRSGQQSSDNLIELTNGNIGRTTYSTC